MAEFNIGGPQQYAAYGGQPAQPAGANVDWYTAPSYGSYVYDQASTSGAAYGSFEDEPPLLEGAYHMYVAAPS
jgi:hypothetical protein